MNWKGVMPAITTCFTEDLRIDHTFMAEHCRWLLDNGCTGIVALGSLGEGATLSFDEKLELLQTCVGAAAGRAPVIASISALTTWEAVALAKAAADRGCGGLMVLPPYVYKGDWREMKTHIASVFRATSLPCMLYNNPIAYGTDFLPEQISELAAEHENFEAVKESSTDARRVSAIRALVDLFFFISIGAAEINLLALRVGLPIWVAGLANAFPRESVDLMNLGIQGKSDQAFELYRWFLPLLRMDTVYNFVQLIKLVQAEVGMGSSRVRPPRLELIGRELEAAQQTIRDALRTRPQPVGV